eukprot:scaffold19167_cov34-Tisochrysis_lutea.AAC.1
MSVRTVAVHASRGDGQAAPVEVCRKGQREREREAARAEVLYRAVASPKPCSLIRVPRLRGSTSNVSPGSHASWEQRTKERAEAAAAKAAQQAVDDEIRQHKMVCYSRLPPLSTLPSAYAGRTQQRASIDQLSLPCVSCGRWQRNVGRRRRGVRKRTRPRACSTKW